MIRDTPRIVRTGVTAIWPRGQDIWTDYVFAGFHSFNGNGEMTGLPWIAEQGYIGARICITNTYQVGIVWLARCCVSFFPWTDFLGFRKALSRPVKRPILPHGGPRLRLLPARSSGQPLFARQWSNPRSRAEWRLVRSFDHGASLRREARISIGTRMPRAFCAAAPSWASRADKGSRRLLLISSSDRPPRGRDQDEDGHV
jgi:Peptidase family S58